MELKKYKNNWLFIPLGGAKEIGMNLNLYHFKGKWVIIDMGIGFSGDRVPGIDVLVPDPAFLNKIKNDILGIVITHAHEDHLGAVQYLWNEVKKPVYTSEFTGLFLKEKLKEYQLHDKVEINKIKVEKEFDLRPFKLEFIPINHSVPEMNAVIVSTDKGRIFHTGDWKFDHNPVIGKPDDFKKLKAIGDAGILALVGDSTNVFNEGHSGSEGDLQQSLKKIVKEQKNLVVVASFASNLGRIISLIEAAKTSQRKIVICGRALERIVRVGVELGYIKDMKDFVPRDKIKNYPRNKLLLIATGCQGEDRAAINRLSLDIYPSIKVQKNDTIIFSSKIIPGNELKIGRVLNSFSAKEIKVITERSHFVHVSGHPGREELKKMYNLIRPKTVIPVHGEIMHINEHAKFSKSVGIKNIVRVTNGSCVVLDQSVPQVVGEVVSGYLGVDGNSLIDIKSPVIKQRRVIAENGVIIVHIEINRRGSLLKTPALRGPGLFDVSQDKDIILYLSEMLFKHLKSGMKNYVSVRKNKSVNINESGIQNEIKSILKKLLKQSIAKTPLIEVLVTCVD